VEVPPEVQLEMGLTPRVVWSDQYFYLHEHGWTLYDTPFLEVTQVAGLQGGYAIIPRNSRRVAISRLGQDDVETVQLPIQLQPFRARVIEHYRDSLVASARRSGRAAPSAIQAIEKAYNSIPTPEFAPAVRRMVTIGGDLWVEAFPASGEDLVRWYVVDPVAMSVRARVDLPATAILLGGGTTSVALLTRDELGVESVQVCDLVLQ